MTSITIMFKESQNQTKMSLIRYVEKVVASVLSENSMQLVVERTVSLGSDGSQQHCT